MGLLRSALLKASESRWLADNLPRLAFSRRAVRRFMPGETLEDALAECARLGERGTGTVITRLGENITDLRAATDVTRHYLDALSDIERKLLPTHLSVKLTQLGLDIATDQVVTHMATITSHAERMQAPVWIDMESSAYTDRTIEIFRRLRQQEKNVGLCVQAYLHRTQQDIADLLQSTTAIRLVKGAYKEPNDVALPRKRDVDTNYLRCAEQLLIAAQKRTIGYVPAFATHDVDLIERIQSTALKLGVAREQFEFQMLYGINVQQQQALATAGYRLRVLISYGNAWFAWYMRRLAERPANIWFVAKSVLG
ncbi:MAG TPA: proline dehydrogenase family protein [Longimicrobiales bacterium]|nr:proline dehydrogenase family protein [Longimicrobiales bacterium]